MSEFLNNLQTKITDINKIEFDVNKKRGEIKKGKKINDQKNYLDGFYFERGRNSEENNLLKIAAGLNDHEILFKKIIKPHDFSGDNEKNKNRAFKKYFALHGISYGENKEKRFGKNLNQNSKSILDFRKEMEDKMEDQPKTNKSNWINEDDIEIKFNNNSFNFFTETNKLSTSFQIPKNDQNQDFVKDLFFNIFLLGNLDLTIRNIIFEINPKNQKEINLGIIDFEMGLDFEKTNINNNAMIISSSNDFIKDNKKLFFKEKNSLSLAEALLEFIFFYNIQPGQRINNQFLKELIQEQCHTKTLNFFKNFINQFSDSGLIDLMEKMTQKFDDKKDQIQDQKAKNLLEKRNQELKKEIKDFKENKEKGIKRKKFYCQLKEKVNNFGQSLIIKSKFIEKIHQDKFLKNYNNEQIDVLWNILKNKDELPDINNENSNLTKDQSKLLDSFIEKNSYLYINKNKQKFSNFSKQALILLIKPIWYLTLANAILFPLKLLKITDLISSLCLKILNFIENKLSKNFEKLENFFKLEISYKKLFVSIFISIITLLITVIIHLISFYVINNFQTKQILQENSEVSQFLDLKQNDEINLISMNYFVQ